MGLHRVGPAPYDFEYDPIKGERVNFDVRGATFTGMIVDFDRNDETGELKLTIA